MSSTTPNACLVKDAVVYFLVDGACSITISQGGITYRVLTTTVSRTSRIVAPARAQQLRTINFGGTRTTLTTANKAQLQALLPTLLAAKIVIVYGFSSGNATDATLRSNDRARAVASYLAANGVKVASYAGYGSMIRPAGESTLDRVDIGIG